MDKLFTRKSGIRHFWMLGISVVLCVAFYIMLALLSDNWNWLVTDLSKLSQKVSNFELSYTILCFIGFLGLVVTVVSVALYWIVLKWSLYCFKRCWKVMSDPFRDEYKNMSPEERVARKVWELEQEKEEERMIKEALYEAEREDSDDSFNSTPDLIGETTRVKFEMGVGIIPKLVHFLFGIIRWAFFVLLWVLLAIIFPVISPVIMLFVMNILMQLLEQFTWALVLVALIGIAIYALLMIVYPILCITRKSK